MKKVLKYSGKHGDEMWDASTPHLELVAMQSLFKMLDKDMKMWDWIEKYTEEVVEEECSKCHHVRTKKVKGKETMDYTYYKLAKKGDSTAIRMCLKRIKDHEYGYWEITTVR